MTARQVLQCVGARRDCGWPHPAFLILCFSRRWTVGILFFRHGFRRGAHFVLLIFQTTEERGGDGFFLAHFGGGGLALGLGLLRTLRLRGLATEEIDQKQGSNLSEDRRAHRKLAIPAHSRSPWGKVYHSRAGQRALRRTLPPWFAPSKQLACFAATRIVCLSARYRSPAGTGTPRRSQRLWPAWRPRPPPFA